MKIRFLNLFLIAVIISGCASGVDMGGSDDSVSVDTLDPVSPIETVEEKADTPSVEPEESSDREVVSKFEDKKVGETALRSDEFVGSDGGLEFLVEEAEASPSGVPSSSEDIGRSSRSNSPAASGLKAGFADDNRQFGYFLRFLEEFGSQITYLPMNVDERIRIEIQDKDGKPLSGAKLNITTSDFTETGVTMADGSYYFYPPETGEEFFVTVVPDQNYPRRMDRFFIDRNGPRTQKIELDIQREAPDPLPLDIVFVMDTTGSMGEEILRLKNTIEIIYLNLSALSPRASVRFGMVLYRDVEDAYRTQIIPLTDNLDEFQRSLAEVEAGGGGDTPEDLQAALDDTLHSMNWNSRGIRLGYIITDAPPHIDYGQAFDYTAAAIEAKARGIKLFGIGTGGLDLQGEVILRQIAQYTSGRYIFLTYGEEGEGGGGAPGSVSHHTGSNWNADKLENIIIRFSKEEVAYQSDTPLEQDDPWFEAGSVPNESTEETLSNLFAQALDQLLDFTTFRITKDEPLAVLPFLGGGESDGTAVTAEYFTEHFILSALKSDRITLAERKDVAQIIEEQTLQNSGLTEEETVSALGNLLNAEFLISGNLYEKDENYELFLKLLRTETGEVLAITRAVLDKSLGL